MFHRRCSVALAILAVLQAFPAAQAQTNKPDENAKGRWALLIGVDEYIKAEKLRYCGADIRALAQRLEASGFARDHIYLLHDKAEETQFRPVKANIEEKLKLVLGLVETGDLVLVAFSGHGIHRDGKSYLCPPEVNLDDATTMVSLDSVYQQLQNCQAAFKLLVVDACRDDPRLAGQKSLRSADEIKQFAVAMEEPPQGIMLMTSCGVGEISMEEKEFGHGVFMHFLLEGLTGLADVNRNGAVSLLELALYTNDKTKNHVARKYGGWQRPALKGDTPDFDFLPVLTPVARREPQPKPTAVPAGTKQVDVIFTVRDGSENGPELPGAEVSLWWRASASSAPAMLGNGKSDQAGRVKMTVNLSSQQLAGGSYEAVIRAGTAAKKWMLPNFPQTLKWNAWVPRPAAATTGAPSKRPSSQKPGR